MAVSMDWFAVLDTANGVLGCDTGSVKERSVTENQGAYQTSLVHFLVGMELNPGIYGRVFFKLELLWLIKLREA